MRKISMTATDQQADLEIISEGDDRGLRLEPQQGSGAELLLGGFGVKPPEKLNTCTYLAVNFVCIFAHKCYKYAEKSV